MTVSKRHSHSAGLNKNAPEMESLFRDHWNRVCMTVYRVVGDWAEAEDLALEAFLRLHRRPPADKRNLEGWLYKVGINLGINALRARQRRQHYEAKAGVLATLETPGHNPETTYEHKQEQQLVRKALSAMKPRAAQILMLRYSGQSYAEIAAALQIAPGSVGTLLARAEREFEKQFSPE